MMKLCNETITVFNARYDAQSGYDTYIGTVITGASWHCEVASAVTNDGLKAANRFTVRIPVDADSGGKSYADPRAYRDAASVSGLFTLANGDIVVKGAVTGSVQPKGLQEQYEMFRILGVSDDRRAKAPHWKVVGA